MYHSYSLLINAAVFLLSYLVLKLYFYILNHNLDLNITDTALKLPHSLYCFTTNYISWCSKLFPQAVGYGHL